MTKKIVMVIAFRDFSDEEYFIPKEILEKAGFEITTASNFSGIATGAYGGEIKVDILLDDLRVDDFEAIVFVGGTGAAKYVEDERIHSIIREFAEKNKVLAAICLAPAILARAGVLKNKKATAWLGPLDKTFIRVLEQEGAEYVAKSVVIDGKVITANGPTAAREFAQAIVRVLTFCIPSWPTTI